jgi:hypothetical protein
MLVSLATQPSGAIQLVRPNPREEFILDLAAIEKATSNDCSNAAAVSDAGTGKTSVGSWVASACRQQTRAPTGVLSEV